MIRMHGRVRAEGHWRMRVVRARGWAPAEARAEVDARPSLVLAEHESDQIITNNGKAAIVNALALVLNAGVAAANNQQLGGTFAPVYGALGSGTGTPNVADFKLGAELPAGRVQPFATAGGAGVWVWEFFFGAQPQGNVNEMGCFIQGTAVTDTGTLLDRSLVNGGIAKTADVNVLLAFQITLLGI